MTSAGSSRVALVTGANSAIGRACVDALLGRGAQVVATVRSEAAEEVVRTGRDQALRTGALVVDRLEVTDAADCERIMARHRPDVVVNNAGAALLGAVCDIDDDAARAQLEVMVLAPVRLARLLVAATPTPELGSSEVTDRRVINVSSSLSSTPVPFTGWYAGSKAALDTLAERLRVEVAPLGVRVVTVECGAVSTEAWDDAAETVLAGGGDDETAVGRRRWARLTAALEHRFAEPTEIGESVAAAAADADPPPLVRVGFAARLGLVGRLVPSQLQDLVTRAVFGLGRDRQR